MNLLERAMQLHQQGRLRDAEAGYRQCLAENPRNADALHLLGVIAHQFNHDADAIELIGQAIAMNPSCAAYYANQAEAYRSLGSPQQAVECCQKAIAIHPDYPEAFNNLGLALMRLGQYEEAEVALRRAVELRPDFPHASNNLGQALREQGRTEEAIRAYRAAVALNPEQAEAHNNLGQLLLEQQALDEALVHCREAVRLRPEMAEAQSNLGNVFREQGKSEAAMACYREALRLNPGIAMIYNNMAQAMQEAGRFDDAAHWYQQALERDGNSPRFHNNLASLLVEKEDFEQAEQHFLTAIGLAGDTHESWNGLGCLYRDQSKYDASLESLRKAIGIKPDYAPAHYNLGQTLAELGTLDEAYDCYRRAIACDARHIGAWTQLATHYFKRLASNDVEQIEELVQTPWLKPAASAALQFAVGHIRESQHDYTAAADAFSSANQRQRIGRENRGEFYDQREHERLVSSITEVFTSDWFERTNAWGLETNVPVMIVGMPRSGTTLTEQILACHPDVHGAGELRQARESYERVAAFDKLNREAVHAAAQDHLEKLRSLATNKIRIVDKMPDNYLYLGWLVTMFPGLRIIHCRRDVRAIAMSCWKTSFREIRWANSSDDIVHRIKQYERLILHWESHLPASILTVDYEQTVADLPLVARRLIDWLGLEWDERCLDFHRSPRPVRTASVSQVRQPIRDTSVSQWKHYERLVADLFDRLPSSPGSLATDGKRYVAPHD